MPYEPNMYDSHMHTQLCKHARGNPVDYAAEAERKGLRGITFTCHSPMPFGWNPKTRMSVNQFPQYVEMVAEATAQFAGRVDVRLGMESDYLPGMESWLDDLHSQCRLQLHPRLGASADRRIPADISRRLNAAGIRKELLRESGECGRERSLRLPQPS